MQKFSKILLVAGSSLLCTHSLYATVPNTNSPTTFLGPTLQASISALNGTTAWSVLGEAADRNLRVDGTYAWKLKDNQHLKLTFEYLWQRITYPFFAGDASQWVQQGAIGGDYRYILTTVRYQPAITFNAYLSHSPNQKVGPVTGAFIDQAGVFQTFLDRRRAVGSNGLGFAPGVVFRPWCGGTIALNLNYDFIRYAKHNYPDRDAKGFGGTIQIFNHIGPHGYVNLTAANRTPFNWYKLEFGGRDIKWHGDWIIGLFGGYTAGKSTLPTTWNTGLTVNYFLDQTPEPNPCEAQPAAGEAPAQAVTEQAPQNNPPKASKGSKTTKAAAAQQQATTDAAANNQAATSQSNATKKAATKNAANQTNQEPTKQTTTTPGAQPDQGTTTETNRANVPVTKQKQAAATQEVKAVPASIEPEKPPCIPPTELKPLDPDDFWEWTSRPAVYMPEVLSIPKDIVIIPNPLPPA